MKQTQLFVMMSNKTYATSDARMHSYVSCANNVPILGVCSGNITDKHCALRNYDAKLIECRLLFPRLRHG